MKFFLILLVLVGFVGVSYAEYDEPKVPEPTPSCSEGTILKNDTCIETESKCGKGTTYQNGVCVVNEPYEKLDSGKWFTSYPTISQSSQAHDFENTGIFYSKNGTELIVLKKGQEVDIVFQYEFRNDKIFDGYVYYNIAENGKLISQSQNFTISEIPKVFKFTYTPQNVGEFPFTKGSMSHSGIWGGEQGRSIIVLEEFSKAMKFNGQCKKPFPEYTLVVKHDFSTAACVKYDTKQKLIERGWAEPFGSIVKPRSENAETNTEIPDVEKLLIENKINYNPDKLVVTTGASIRGDPGCGAVVDVNSKTQWFRVDSMSNPNELTFYSDNPNQCVVNTVSCFCNVQMELAALTTNKLDYFTVEEQEKHANILIDYLYEENINRTPKFIIGKQNVNYTDPEATGFCGKIWGTATYDYFSGAIVNGTVKDYRINKELPLLCAITNDAQYFGKAYGEE